MNGNKPSRVPPSALVAPDLTASVEKSTTDGLANLSSQLAPQVVLNISNISNVVADSIVESNSSGYVKFKDEFNPMIKDQKLLINTERDPLFLRDEKGAIVGSLPKDTEVANLGQYQIFNSNNTSVVMVKVAYQGLEGFVAGPYLKLQKTTDPESKKEAPKNAPSQHNGVTLVGDSIIVGMGQNAPNKAAFLAKEGRSTADTLIFLRNSLTNKTLTPERSPTVLLFGLANDLGPQNTGNYRTALDNIKSMVTLLKQYGIKPILSTHFVYKIGTIDFTDTVNKYNNAIKDLARTSNLPLIDFGSIENKTGSLHNPDIYKQMLAMVSSYTA